MSNPLSQTAPHVSALDLLDREIGYLQDALDRTKQALRERDEQLDALTRQVANANDSRHVTLAKQALQHLHAVLQTLRKETGGPSEERIRNNARAFCVEQGGPSEEIEVMRKAYEEWECRR